MRRLRTEDGGGEVAGATGREGDDKTGNGSQPEGGGEEGGGG